jgi:hypothetical protein
MARFVRDHVYLHNRSIPRFLLRDLRYFSVSTPVACRKPSRCGCCTSHQVEWCFLPHLKERRGLHAKYMMGQVVETRFYFVYYYIRATYLAKYAEKYSMCHYNLLYAFFHHSGILFIVCEIKYPHDSSNI